MGLLPVDADILPPSDDRVFKVLLTNPSAKPGLIKLISAIIGRNVVDVEIYPNELPIGSTEEKTERFDVNCKIDDGSQVNIEMYAHRIQEDVTGEYKNFFGKNVYYLTDLHSSQPSRGIRYDHLARTYQITFCSFTVFPDRAGYVNSFSLRNDETGEQLCDAIRLIIVELSKLRELLEKPVAEMTDLDKWSLFLRYASDPKQREKVNEVIESEEVLQMAGNLLMSISQDERERAIFRSRRKFETDYASDMLTAEDRGKKIGEEIGKKIGEEIGEERGKKIGEEIGEKRGIGIGKQAGKIEIAQNLLKMGLPIDQIAAATQLTQAEIEALQ